MSIMDSTVLTTLVDRWRPETNTFHLPCGEATVTLQDGAMLLGLHIDGHPMCGLVDPIGWRDMVGDLIGIHPPDVEPNEMDKKPSGIHSGWMRTNFHTYLEGVNDGVVYLSVS
jgi:hypothetical protein